MEREIKFRGRTKDGEWLKGNLIQFNEMCSIVSNKTIEDTPLDYVGAAIVKGIVDAETVGQYTGMRDKNEKEIYEGDITKDKNGHICIILYRNGGFVLDIGTFFWHLRNIDTENSVVIGNIHDNPELIKR